jgi:tetratricopeptide (TPR) repeat protein
MADNVVFQEAMDALREGNKAHARETLTGLIKEDQNNAEYWIWLSAAMDTTKERIYCLQTAFKLDPENAAAKRGLILLGAMPADETIQPFPMNHPRAWEENLLLAYEKPKLKGWAAIKASPVVRLGLVILLVGAIAGAVTFGFLIPAANRNTRPPTSTPGPSPTYTLTVTVVGGRPQTQVVGTPGGVSELLEVPYTPTALYVPTERSPLTSDFLLQFSRAYADGDWDEAIDALQQVINVEPDAAFAYYYLGEAYRFKGQPGIALTQYGTAIEKDPDFGAAYVGQARAQLQSNSNANVLSLLDDAIRLDPNFGEAYLERARVKIRDNDIQGAIADLGEANDRLTGSPLVYYYLAQARLQESDYELALNAATRANELDVTHLPTYLLLGQIHAQMENYEEAIDALNIYLKYAPNDISTYFLLGSIQFDTADYEASIQSMNEVIAAESSRADAYLYRFLANIELGDGDAADEDLDTIIQFYSDSFEANLAIMRLHLLQDRNGSALQYLERTEPLAQTDEQEALFYYWGALVYEAREDFNNAARYWNLLLDLPEESMTEEMRETAQEHLLDIRTAVPTPSPTRTRTPTATKSVTPTPTRTPTPIP